MICRCSCCGHTRSRISSQSRKTCCTCSIRWILIKYLFIDLFNGEHKDVLFPLSDVQLNGPLAQLHNFLGFILCAVYHRKKRDVLTKPNDLWFVTDFAKSSKDFLFRPRKTEVGQWDNESFCTAHTSTASPSKVSVNEWHSGTRTARSGVWQIYAAHAAALINWRPSPCNMCTFSFLSCSSSPAAPSPREPYTKFDSLSAFAAFFSRGRAKELEVDCW